MSRHLFVRFMAPGSALLLVLITLELWNVGQSAAVLRVLHVAATQYIQADRPFGDARSLISVMECYRKGVDIFIVNPCDPYNRPLVYSSVWLLGARLPITTAWTNVIGSGIAIAFCLSLFLLPHARDLKQAIVMTAGTLSNAVIFACYQANNDLVVFIIVAIAGRWLPGPARVRSCGYALLLLAGSLKFYPITLMVLALRERVRPFLAILSVSLLAAGTFVWFCGRDALRTMHVIPAGKITQMFGASVIARGLAVFPAGIEPSVAAPPPSAIGSAAEAVLIIGGAAIIIRMARSPRVRTALRSLTDQEALFAVLGCILILSCFFSGESYRYRAIFLLFALPAASAGIGGFVPITIIFLLWSVQIGNGLDHALIAVHMTGAGGADLFAAFWLGRELAWWGMVAVLAGMMGVMVGRRSLAAGLWSRA